jgi:hypothetical protein
MSLLAREHRLRDLVARLDQALDTPELLDYDENDVAEIAWRAVDRVEGAIKAAADFLHELNAKERASRAVPQLRDGKVP